MTENESLHSEGGRPDGLPAPLKAISALSSAAGAIASILLVVATGLIFADLLQRNLSGRSIAGVTEISSWLMAAIGWLALSYALKNDRHIEVTIVFDRLPARAQRAVRVLVDLGSILFLLVLTKSMGSRLVYFMRTDAVGVETRWPTWWVYAVVLTGGALFLLQFIPRLFSNVGIWRRNGNDRAFTSGKSADDSGIQES